MEGADGSTIAGHGVVGEMSPHHACQPPPLFGDGQMPTSHELVLDLLEFRPQPLRNGVAPEPEAPVLALPADVREAQEVERPWLPANSGGFRTAVPVDSVQRFRRFSYRP